MRAADDGGRRKRPEVPPVQRVRRLPVHQEELTRGDDVASLPDGKRPTPSVAFARRAHRNRIDHYREPFPTNGLPGKRQDALQHGNATRQIAAVCEEDSEGLWRQDGNKFGDVPFRFGRTSVPLINGATTQLECVVRQRVEAGDHIVVLGEVIAADVTDAPPLVYAQRNFHKISGERNRAA